MAIAKRWMTEEEFMRMPEDGYKYELVDGEPKYVPTTFEHDVIGSNLVVMLAPHAKGRGFITLSQAGYRMSSGNIRVPDIAFTRKERLPGGRPPKAFGDLAPDLCVEIVSPSEDWQDFERKIGEYFASGAQQVWRIDPEAQIVRVYASPSESVDYGPGDEITGGDLLPGFRAQVIELFEMD